MRRLLLNLALLLCAVGSYALDRGDYVYTYTQRFKVTGSANLIKNGDFSAVDPTADNFRLD